MKIKLSELNSLISEVAQNNEISKGIALIIDKQGCDTDEAITIYIKDNPNADENAVTQALTDFPISNGMDKAFMEEGLERIIDEVLAEIDDDGDEVTDEFEDTEFDTTNGDEGEEEEEGEKIKAGEETAEDLYGGEQKFNHDVQRALSIINQVVNEPREYFALMNGQTTPEGMPVYPGVFHMVVMNPREKRRAMRVILGKRLGDFVMDHLESGREG